MSDPPPSGNPPPEGGNTPRPDNAPTGGTGDESATPTQQTPTQQTPAPLSISEAAAAAAAAEPSPPPNQEDWDRRLSEALLHEQQNTTFAILHHSPADALSVSTGVASGSTAVPGTSAAAASTTQASTGHGTTGYGLPPRVNTAGGATPINVSSAGSATPQSGGDTPTTPGGTRRRRRRGVRAGRSVREAREKREAEEKEAREREEREAAEQAQEADTSGEQASTSATGQAVTPATPATTTAAPASTPIGQQAATTTTEQAATPAPAGTTTAGTTAAVPASTSASQPASTPAASQQASTSAADSQWPGLPPATRPSEVPESPLSLVGPGRGRGGGLGGSSRWATSGSRGRGNSSGAESSASRGSSLSRGGSSVRGRGESPIGQAGGLGTSNVPSGDDFLGPGWNYTVVGEGRGRGRGTSSFLDDPSALSGGRGDSSTRGSEMGRGMGRGVNSPDPVTSVVPAVTGTEATPTPQGSGQPAETLASTATSAPMPDSPGGSPSDSPSGSPSGPPSGPPPKSPSPPPSSSPATDQTSGMDQAAGADEAAGTDQAAGIDQAGTHAAGSGMESRSTQTVDISESGYADAMDHLQRERIAADPTSLIIAQPDTTFSDFLAQSQRLVPRYQWPSDRTSTPGFLDFLRIKYLAANPDARNRTEEEGYSGELWGQQVNFGGTAQTQPPQTPAGLDESPMTAQAVSVLREGQVRALVRQLERRMLLRQPEITDMDMRVENLRRRLEYGEQRYLMGIGDIHPSGRQNEIPPANIDDGPYFVDVGGSDYPEEDEADAAWRASEYPNAMQDATGLYHHLLDLAVNNQLTPETVYRWRDSCLRFPAEIAADRARWIKEAEDAKARLAELRDMTQLARKVAVMDNWRRQSRQAREYLRKVLTPEQYAEMPRELRLDPAEPTAEELEAEKKVAKANNRYNEVWEKLKAERTRAVDLEYERRLAREEAGDNKIEADRHRELWSEMNDKVGDLTRELSSSQERNAALESQVAELKATADAVSEEAQTIDEPVEETRRRIAQCLVDGRKKDEEIAGLQAQVDRIRFRLGFIQVGSLGFEQMAREMQEQNVELARDTKHAEEMRQIAVKAYDEQREKCEQERERAKQMEAERDKATREKEEAERAREDALKLADTFASRNQDKDIAECQRELAREIDLREQTQRALEGWRTACDSANQYINQLRRKAKGLQKRWDDREKAMQKELDEVKQTVDSLREERRETLENRPSLREENDRLLKENQKLHQAAADNATDLQSIKDQLATAEADLKDARDALSSNTGSGDSDTQNSILGQRLTEAEAALKETRGQLDQAKKDLDELRDRQSSASPGDDDSECWKKLAAEKAAREQVEEERDRLQEKLDELSNETPQPNPATSDDAAECQKKLAAEVARRTQAEQRLRDLEIDLSQQRVRLAAAEAHWQQAEADAKQARSSLEEQASMQAGHIDDLMHQLEKKATAKEKAEARVKVLQEQLDQLSGPLEGSGSAAPVDESAMFRFRVELEKARKAVADAKRTESVKDKEIERLRGRLAKLHEAIKQGSGESAEGEAGGVGGDAAAQAAAADTLVGDLEYQLDLERQRTRTLSEMIMDLEREWEVISNADPAMRDFHSDFRDELVGFTKRLRNLVRDNTQLQAMLDDLERNAGNLYDENEDLRKDLTDCRRHRSEADREMLKLRQEMRLLETRLNANETAMGTTIANLDRQRGELATARAGLNTSEDARTRAEAELERTRQQRDTYQRRVGRLSRWATALATIGETSSIGLSRIKTGAAGDADDAGDLTIPDPPEFSDDGEETPEVRDLREQLAQLTQSLNGAEVQVGDLTTQNTTLGDDLKQRLQELRQIGDELRESQEGRRRAENIAKEYRQTQEEMAKTMRTLDKDLADAREIELKLRKKLEEQGTSGPSDGLEDALARCNELTRSQEEQIQRLKSQLASSSSAPGPGGSQPGPGSPAPAPGPGDPPRPGAIQRLLFPMANHPLVRAAMLVALLTCVFLMLCMIWYQQELISLYGDFEETNMYMLQTITAGSYRRFDERGLWDWLELPTESVTMTLWWLTWAVIILVAMSLLGAGLLH